MLGELVDELVNQEYEAGYHKIEFSTLGGSASGRNATSYASGIYIYRLVTKNFVDTKKMVLMK